MLRLLTLLTLVTLFSRSLAQEGKIVMHVQDAFSGVGVPGAMITDGSAKVISHSDTSGYAVIPAHAFAAHTILIVIATGYSPDTLTEPVLDVYLRRPLVDLPAATISGAKARRLLNSEAEYVVDYCFAGDNIIAATYSGDNGRKAKLVLMNSNGDELGRTKLSTTPVSMFTSCVGNNYCACDDGFYLLATTDGLPQLARRYDRSLQAGLQQCDCSCQGSLYYRVNNKTSFRTVYGRIARGDSIFRPFKIFEEAAEARASYEELMEIIALYNSGQFSLAARKAGHRSMWDKGALAHINLPIFAVADTLVVFDYRGKQIWCFDTGGKVLATVPTAFDWRSAQQFEILKDDVTSTLYIHRYGNQERHTIETLDIHTGATGPRIALVHPFADKVRLHDSTLYYLWQDAPHHRTRQLYIQQLN